MASSKTIWFGSFEVVINEDSCTDHHKDVMMEDSTLIFPSNFVKRELDIIFGSNNHKKLGDIQVHSDRNSESKDLKLIVPDELIMSDELNIKFGTCVTDKREIKDDEKASVEVVEDIDKNLEIQNYLMKVLKLDQENKILSSYEEELMETMSLGLCRDRLALHYLCSIKAGRFVARWISDEEYLKAIETRKTDSSVELRISADQNEEKIVGENAITVKENDPTEKIKRNADVAKVQAEARDQTVTEQKETVDRFLEQCTKNDIANEITSVQAVSSVGTRKSVSCIEEVHTDDQCDKIVADNNKQIMKNEECVEPIVTSGIIADTKEENVCEISKEEIVSKVKVEHLLEETKKINEEIESHARNDEEARMQDEVQAQKEAKKKEKARLKRLRNKEKKRAAISNSNISYQDALESNGSNELPNTNEEEKVYEINKEQLDEEAHMQDELRSQKEAKNKEKDFLKLKEVHTDDQCDKIVAENNKQFMKIEESVEPIVTKAKGIIDVTKDEKVCETSKKEAQMHAEVQARKEAKKKEMARLKRLRNKEKKRAAFSNNIISYQDDIESNGSKEVHDTNEEEMVYETSIKEVVFNLKVQHWFEETEQINNKTESEDRVDEEAPMQDESEERVDEEAPMQDEVQAKKEVKKKEKARPKRSRNKKKKRTAFYKSNISHQDVVESNGSKELHNTTQRLLSNLSLKLSKFKTIVSPSSVKLAVESFLQQHTKNDVDEEVQVDDQCNKILADNNKQTMKNEESDESIVTSGIIDDTEEEKVFEISKEEIVSNVKMQHLLEETKKINEEIESRERVDEEARMQGEVQAQKEAKKKEKARIKRLRNKEKKMAAISNNNINYQHVVETNGSNESKELPNTNDEEKVYEINKEQLDEEARMQDEVRAQKEAKKKEKDFLKLKEEIEIHLKLKEQCLLEETVEKNQPIEKNKRNADVDRVQADARDQMVAEQKETVDSFLEHKQIMKNEESVELIVTKGIIDVTKEEKVCEISTEEARKEAKKKEKARQKRLRNKEKKRVSFSNNNIGYQDDIESNGSKERHNSNEEEIVYETSIEEVVSNVKEQHWFDETEKINETTESTERVDEEAPMQDEVEPQKEVKKKEKARPKRSRNKKKKRTAFYKSNINHQDVIESNGSKELRNTTQRLLSNLSLKLSKFKTIVSPSTVKLAVGRYLEQRTKIDVANEIETRKHVSCIEEVHADDQCDKIVAQNNKQIMINEESDEFIVTNGIIDDTKEEKVCEISKDEIVSKMKMQHLLEEIKKINEEIESHERVDEEARMQVETQAQKETKKKEKARLKRLRNKEKKMAAISDNNINYQNDVESTGSNESKELHNTNEEEKVYEINKEQLDEEAQMQDEVRTQKEATKKEKARLKRLRNKEKKRVDVVESNGSHLNFFPKLSEFETIVSPSTVKLAVKKILLAITLVLSLVALIGTNY